MQSVIRAFMGTVVAISAALLGVDLDDLRDSH